MYLFMGHATQIQLVNKQTKNFDWERGIEDSDEIITLYSHNMPKLAAIC